ncbi:protein kinase [Geothrix sp. PMB-07]|uniref:protein kinase domain-containing protein n=1 Tax=Geothrix sp. PMB-07 TaxID=3068640 RepID=UPI002741C43F|nr:protein kinase [Geothrix sp. PMB-07]WLT32564.1 protein kinase [Geothrix sp. PMB-07]
MNPKPQPDLRLTRLAGVMDGRYAFLSLLGEGGSGRVYEVRNLSLDRREAMKVLSETLLDDHASERFTREARIAASLDHPGIVKIHAFGRNDGIHWYSMALVDGPTLGDLVDKGRLLDAPMLAQVALPLLEALAFSHAQGVIHRDIKPANILFDLQGRPYLADFGIAKSEANAMKTQTGILMGTPAYVSPEQALGEAVDARTDQYSLGITLYKALTGRLPFHSDNLLQTLVLRLNEAPEPLVVRRPDLGPEVSAILMKALARDRNERWASVEDMRKALAAVLVGTAQTSASARLLEGFGPPLRTPLPGLEATAEGPVLDRGSFAPTAELPVLPKGRKAPLWVAVAVAVALVLVAGGGLAWRRLHRPSVEPAQPERAVPTQVAISSPSKPLGAEVSGSVRKAAEAPVPGPVPERRAVVYPQLMEEAVGAGPTVAGCAGLRVNVSLVVGEDGLVRQCKVLSSIPIECAEAAKAVALRYRFKPALDAQGKPLQTTVAAAVDFPELP